MKEENIQIILYNKTYLMNVSCTNNNELSKLYFNDNKNYLIIYSYKIYPCFKNCSNKIYENDIDCLNKGENEEN